VEKDTLTLPIQITSRVEVGRLLREVEQVDDFLKQGAVREPGTAVKMPKTSRLLDELVEVNNMNLLHDDDRARVWSFLIAVKTKAPLLHMSFGADPAPAFVQKLMTWLRKEIHPLLLLEVGLQPNIGAGCVVRGTSAYFDFSLREHFKKQRPLLLTKLHGDIQLDTSGSGADKAAVANSVAVTPPVPESVATSIKKPPTSATATNRPAPHSIEVATPTTPVPEPHPDGSQHA